MYMKAVHPPIENSMSVMFVPGSLSLEAAVPSAVIKSSVQLFAPR